jgi:hypothetical protein
MTILSIHYCFVYFCLFIKEKVQRDKQRSTKHTYKTEDRVTRTPLKTGGELRCSGRVAVPAPLVTPVVLI